MASTLVSPGVQVDIINESFYGTAGPGTIPLIVIATAANKTAPSGSGIAPATVPSQAGVLFLATSQLELTSNFGVPYFASYQGTMLQGNETNEWGLHAAYSYLGMSNRCYVLRADIDTSQLTATAIAPTGTPNAGQYWLNLTKTTFGIFMANGNAQPGLAWVPQTVLVPTINQIDSTSTYPLSWFGSLGNFAIVPWTNSNVLYQKLASGWQEVGSPAWNTGTPTVVIGTTSYTTATIADASTIIIDGTTVPIVSSTSPSPASLDDVVAAINGAAIANITASQTANKLYLTDSTGAAITITVGSASSVLTALGLVAQTYPGVSYTMSANPQYPSGAVAGSVWMKGNPPRNGASWVIEYYNASTSAWISLSAPFYQFDSTLTDGTVSKDTAASTGLGVPTIGSVYIGFDPSQHVMQPRRWNGRMWTTLSYVAGLLAPVSAPDDGTLWYDSPSSFAADIMVGNGNEWKGYRNIYPATDPNGVQISGSAPTTQSNGNPLVANDLWLDSSDTENYPLLYVWNANTLRWTLIDKTDQVTPFGIIFADARLDSGTVFTAMVNPGAYAYGSTTPSDLVQSDFVMPDAPNPELYPAGMLLFNKRIPMVNTVKIYRSTYFQPGTSPNHFDPNDDYTVNSYTVGNTAFVFPPLSSPACWVDAAGNDSANNNLPFMGRKSQRAMIVAAMRAVVETNQDIRSELVYFNLIACPGYCELIETMTNLNVDQHQVSLIVADTPMRLTPDANALLAWANNAKNVAYTTEDGLAPGDYGGALGDYVAMYYPWGLDTDLSGNEVMIPASTVALRTIAYNDQVAYPWFAPAGFTRGLVSNASSVGYLSATGAFQPVILNQGQRDILYGVRPTGCQINPIAYIPGRGLVVYGQKTLSGDSSALDRVNVTRLINYITYQLDNLLKPFLFEQNDTVTQKAAKHTVEVFFNGLVNLRAITDYAVKCDSDNNTPDRINRNELWVDTAIIPEKAVEFIYIPVRVLAASSSPITLDSTTSSASANS